jgi:SAM-dependent methyltransferase
VSEYDAGFFGWQADGSASSAAVIAPLIDALIAPRSVLDVGCGVGTWTAMWPDAVGVDGDWVPENALRVSRNNFIAHDLRTPLHLTWNHHRGRRFDMALCVEVAEHLPRKAGPTLVASLCEHADVVVFSAAVPGQDGVGHINLHWPSYWAKLFASHGYAPYDLLRDDIWWDQRVEWWYRQNIVIFANQHGATRLKSGTTSYQNRSLDLAHPALLMPELQDRLQATVCIPWRPSPSRLAAFERVKKFWSMFGWPVITADSDTEIFSLSQARNNAVRQATTDVVVVSDADTLVDPLNVLRAVADPAGVWWPFTKYRILKPEYLDTPLAQLAGVPYVNTWDGEGTAGVGGCMVASAKEWWRLGGQPPEFIGWGWEDVAFTLVVETLSRARRLRGHVYAFEHNTNAERYVGATADSPGWDRTWSANEPLMKPYTHARGRPWIMREFLQRRDASPLGVSRHENADNGLPSA